MKKLILTVIAFSSVYWGLFELKAETHVSGSITSDTTWTSDGSPYVVDSSVSVQVGATLTIEAGVTVQFPQYQALYIYGSLDAQGSSGSKITFTGTTESAGWWRGIQISGAGSATFDYCTISYGGYYENINLLKTGTGSISLKNSTISYCNYVGLKLYTNTGTQTFASNTISNNETGIWLGSGTSFDDDTSTFSSNSGADVYVEGGTISNSTTLNLNKNYSFYFLSSTIAEGGTLTIKPDTVVKFPQYNHLYVQGTLDAQGTSTTPIYFTDWRDDTVGGDANKDTTTTTPAAGWWRGIQISGAGAATMDYCTITYSGYYEELGLSNSGSGNLTLSNSTVSSCIGDGVKISNCTGVNTLTSCTFSGNSSTGLSISNNTVTVSGCTFSNNNYGAWQAVGDYFDYSLNTFSDNTTASVGVAGGTMSSSITWSKGAGSSFNIRLTGDITVDASGTLTVKPGVLIKFNQYIGLYIKGTLDTQGTTDSGITFTGSSETTGWWRGLQISEAGSATIDYCTISYGGYYENVNLLKTGTGSISLKNSTISYCSHTGFKLYTNTGTQTFASNTISNNQTGIWLGSGTSFDDDTSTFSSNSGADVYVEGGTISNSTSLNLNKNYSFHFLSSTIAEGGTLTIKPDTVVKFPQYNHLYVQGTLDAQGTADTPIYFTDWRDDTVGGDANKDNETTSPAAGWWRGIQISGAGAATLDYCTSSYSGYYEQVNISKTGTGNLIVKNSTISNNTGDGIKFTSSTGADQIQSSTCTACTGAGISLSSSSVDISACMFSSNGYGAKLEVGDYFDFSDNSFSSNTTAAVGVNGGTMSNNVTWSPGIGDAFCFFIITGVTVADGSTLTIKPGTTVKFNQYHVLYIDGTLDAQGTSSSPIYFTDYRDDTLGGDSNGDGSDTTPAAGWWRGIQVREGGAATMDYCTVSYSGYYELVNILKTGSGNFTLKNSSSTYSSGSGLKLSSCTGELALSRNTFSSNVYGVYFATPPSGAKIEASNFESNSQYGAYNDSTTLVTATGNWWGDESGPYNATSNPDGTGNTVSDNITFDPWKNSDSSSTILAPMRSGEIVAGDTLRFIGQKPDDGTFSYLWDLAESRKSLIKDPGLVAFSTEGTATVTFTLVDSDGEKDPNPDTRTLTVKADSGDIPDLKVTELNVPSSITIGKTAEIKYSVKNIGDAGISSGSWVDAIYLSSDTYLDAGDTLLMSNTQSRSLDVGSTYSDSFDLLIPSASEGNSFLIVSVDDKWEVLELQQLNNEYGSATNIGVEEVVSGVETEGQFSTTNSTHYYRIDVSKGNNLVLTFSGDVTVYLRFGKFPSVGKYDYFIDYNSGSSITVPGAIAGTWYIMVVNKSSSSTAEYKVKVNVDDLIVSSVDPAKADIATDLSLSLIGAGFGAGTTVELVNSTGTSYAAAEVEIDTFTQLTATFTAGTVPVGVYSVKVSRTGKTDSTLTDAIELISSGKAEFTTNLIVPSQVGYHQLATIFVEYSNTGDVAMPAPLMMVYAEQSGNIRGIMTLDKSILSRGFWTSTMPEGFTSNISFLAGGKIPGVLQPGETVKKPIYYAGWQKPWDFSYPAIEFNLAYLTADSTDILIADDLKSSMKPSDLSDEAWEPIWIAFSPNLGTTWGEFVSKLSSQSNYLFRMGKTVEDIQELLNFMLIQSTVLNPVTLSSNSQDMIESGEILPLGFSRIFSQNISRRYTAGPFGFSWTHEWEISLSKVTDDDGGVTATVTIAGDKWKYQSDSRGGFFSMSGDNSTLKTSGDYYVLSKSDGLAYVFDSNGKFSYLQDPNGNKITATYSGDNLTTLTHSAGFSLTFSYSGSLITSVTDAAGRKTSYTYDSESQYLTGVTNYDGTTLAYSYETEDGKASENALTQIVNPDGSKLNYTYDSAGRIASSYYNDNLKTLSFTYGNGGKITLTDALSQANSFYYDNQRMLVKVSDALGSTDVLEYDSDFNLTKETNAEGASNIYQYDDGNMTSFTDSLGGVNTMTYGSYGHIATLADAENNETEFSQDSTANLSGVTYADGNKEAFTYDSMGNVATKTNARGNSITCTYDSYGQMTEKKYSDGTTMTYTYDSSNRLSTAVDVAGTTTFEYNTNNQISKISYPGSRYLEYTYDSAARRSSMTDQLGNVTNYSYDSLGRLSDITDKDGNTIISYSYDSIGRRSKETLGNGVYTVFEYDANSQVTKVVNYGSDASTISSFEYEYNYINQRTSLTTNDGAWAYQYDSSGQLASAIFTSTDTSKISDQSLNFNYDNMGNRTSTVVNGVTSTYTVDNMNHYTAAGVYTYTYDADGNITSSTDGSTTWNYTYNDENLISKAENGTDTYLYGYDALGNRCSMTKNGSKTDYVIDPAGFGNVVGEYDAAGSLSARYEYGAGLVARVDASGNPAYYTYDAVGNTSELTNSSGTAVNTYSYKPFGALLTSTETIDNPYQFVGLLGVAKAAGDIYEMRARVYSPELGRFMQRDPIGLAGLDFNLQRYVNNIPTQYVDPEGEFIFAVSAGVFVLGLTAVVAAPYVKNFSDNMKARRRAIDSAGDWSRKGERKFNRSMKKFNKTRRRMKPLGNAFEQGMKMVGKIDHPYVPAIQSPNDELQEAAKLFGKKDSKSAQSQDPNEKAGPAGYGAANYLFPDGAFSYKIDFENYEDATAPAQVVSIKDNLSTNLDWSSFEVTGVGFGDHIIVAPSGSTQFQTVESMTYESKKLNVEISVSLDMQTGELTALFSTIDPSSELPPAVNYGFLPPEDGTGRGQGYITYTINPKSTLTTGTEIRNIADITFDFSTTIATNQVDPHDASKGTDPTKEALVTIDVDKPISAVGGLSEKSPLTFNVTWSGQDEHSSIAYYSVYVQDNDGDFSLWKENTTETSALYTGTDGHKYSFYSLAKDNAGNVEVAKTAADTSTTADKDTVFAPTVDTATEISSIGADSATSGGEVLTNGGETLTARGVCWSTSESPTVSDSKTTDGTDEGEFTSSITGLSANTTYYVRAYATNSTDTSYGSQVTFTTGEATVPTVTTSTISSIAATSALGGGEVTHSGGVDVSARGVCWSTSESPTITDSKTSDSTGTGSFVSYITGLTVDTTYYVRAYATNSVGTAYGDQTSFTAVTSDNVLLTLDVLPTGAGTVSPSTVTAATKGVPVDISATAATGYVFAGWRVGEGVAKVAKLESTTTATLNSNSTIYAVFVSELVDILNISIGLDNSKLGKDKVSVSKANIPTALTAFDPETDTLSVMIDGYEFDCDSTGTWKTSGSDEKGYKYTYKSAKENTKGKFQAVLDFVKGQWAFKAAKATISDKVDNSDGVDVILKVNDSLYGKAYLMSEKTAWKFSGKKNPAPTAISGLTGIPMTTFTFGEKSKAGGKYDNVKLGKDTFSITNASIELPDGATFDLDKVTVTLDDLEIPITLEQKKTDQKVYTYKSTEAPKISVKIDLEKKNLWSFKMSNGDTSKIYGNNGIDVILKMGDYIGGNSLSVFQKTKLIYKEKK